MAIFPKLIVENKIQENEQTRINGTKSYKTQNEAAITLVRIRPDNALPDWITVAQTLPLVGDVNDVSSFYIDWEYSSAGTYACEIEITTDGAPVVATADIVVVTALVENLFSSDSDLSVLEPDILKYIKEGKSSYMDFHRAAQAQIMDEIYRARIFDVNGDKLTVADVLDVSELGPWSVNVVLKNIFQGISNAKDDVFLDKSKYYGVQEFEARNRAMNQMRLDFNKDATLVGDEPVDMRTLELVRR